MEASSKTTSSAATAFRFDRDADGIAVVTMDMPGRSANVINSEFGEALAWTLEQIQAAKADGLKGVVLTSAKKTFLAGGDLDHLYSLTDPAEAFQLGEELKKGLRMLETCGVPVVAAINGAALGGGLELALACHRRIAWNDRSVKIGFPEVTLGLLPGGGGVTRAVRMLGLEAAAPYLMQGKQMPADAALKAGFVDELAPDRDALLAQAKAWLLSKPEPSQPWDRKGYRLPGGDPRSPAILQRIPAMPALLTKETFNNYPAPEAIMAAAVEGATVDFETASRIESRYFAHLVTGKVAKNMIHTFWFQLNDINKGQSRPAGIERQTTRKVGVLGAGMMGHGIAYESARAGMAVVLKDASLEAAEKGKARIQAILDKLVSRGRSTPEKRQEILDRILPTGNAADLAGCDLVIEAVFEDRELKARVTGEAEAVLDATAVFASNTSTLPITGLAERSRRPSQFIGLHFFSPVDKMKLVEIIRGKQTDDQTLAKAFDYVLAIGKTPIVVNDSRGFYTSRVFSTYTNEGLALLGEGQHPRAIEMAGRQAGMPVGPLALMDEVSLKLAYDISRQTMADGDTAALRVGNHPGFQVLTTMVETYDRKGRAYGGGFYEYPQGQEKQLWPGLRQAFPPAEALSQQEMVDRMLFAQALETVRCLDEGVLTSSADANIGSIFGWGFAPWSGGTLQFINQYGPAEFLARARKLAARYGERFNPPASLAQRVEESATY
jgi:3-hydroxyacyl-CoA dehydrogenase/enoyl-CoA hydratase/3-hydroxybutyryl-CoA epimerase